MEHVFQVGDRVALDNLGYNSFGEITAVVGDQYEIKWDDGFVDDPGYTYDGWELKPENEV